MPSHLSPGVAAPSARSAARRSTRLGVFAALATLALGLVGLSEPAWAQGLGVSGFSPTAAAPAEPVALMGSGFSPDPANHLAFVLGLPGYGVILEPVSTLPGVIETLLGPSAATFEGPVCLWRGRRHLLPGALFVGERGAWLVHFAEIFVPTEATVSAKPFRVEDTTANTGFGAPGTGVIVLEVELRSDGPDPNRIDLVVMIDGGGCGTKPGGGLQESPNLPSRAFHIGLENIDPAAHAVPGALARDLALGLQSTFGAVGLVATADGPWVRVSWSRLATFENAFAVLRFGY